MGKNYFCSLMGTLVPVNPYIHRVCTFAIGAMLTCSLPSPLSCAALGTRGAELGQAEALQDLFPSPGLRVVHTWVNLSCLLCPTAVAAPAACYLLTNLMSRGSPGKENSFFMSPSTQGFLCTLPFYTPHDACLKLLLYISSGRWAANHPPSWIPSWIPTLPHKRDAFFLITAHVSWVPRFWLL